MKNSLNNSNNLKSNNETSEEGVYNLQSNKSELRSKEIYLFNQEQFDLCDA